MSKMGCYKPSQNTKSTTSDMRAMDIRHLQRDGRLKAEEFVNVYWYKNDRKTGELTIFVEDACVTFHYCTYAKGGDWQNHHYKIVIERTPCHFGGSRVWFCCPLCGRKVAKLYENIIFACRHCHHLAYDSQKENKLHRLTRKGNKIRKRLGWNSGMLTDYGSKPKGMHQKTFYQLTAQHDEIRKILYKAIMTRLGGPADYYD